MNLKRQEIEQNITKYKPYIRKVVTGFTIRQFDNNYIVKLDGIEDAIGVCRLADIPQHEREKVIAVEQYFFVKNLSIDVINGSLCLIFNLSRNSKSFPAALLQHITNDYEIKIKTRYRVPGKVCFISCSTPIKQSNLRKVTEILNGEHISLE